MQAKVADQQCTSIKPCANGGEGAIHIAWSCRMMLVVYDGALMASSGVHILHLGRPSSHGRWATQGDAGRRYETLINPGT
jgi:hypothetical protein